MAIVHKSTHTKTGYATGAITVTSFPQASETDDNRWATIGIAHGRFVDVASVATTQGNYFTKLDTVSIGLDGTVDIWYLKDADFDTTASTTLTITFTGSSPFAFAAASLYTGVEQSPATIHWDKATGTSPHVVHNHGLISAGYADVVVASAYHDLTSGGATFTSSGTTTAKIGFTPPHGYALNQRGTADTSNWTSTGGSDGWCSIAYGLFEATASTTWTPKQVSFF